MRNRYAYIRNFYDLFIKYGLHNENPFHNVISNKELKEIYNLQDEEEIEPLTTKEIECILEGYEESREPERNRLMFLLCLYCSVTRRYCFS